VPNERISVLDAIGMAGDLTIFGRRDNVLLVREREGKKVLTRLNLNSSDLFRSPYYYLQQNDLLYIEPNKSKAATNDMAQIRNISIITSLATLATIIISRL
jgi:polysaccharide export outer membrane protein